MNSKISKAEFKAKALELFRHVEATGEFLIVTDHGRPTLEIRPYRSSARSPLEILHGSVIRYIDPAEPVSPEDWDAVR